MSLELKYHLNTRKTRWFPPIHGGKNIHISNITKKWYGLLLNQNGTRDRNYSTTPTWLLGKRGGCRQFTINRYRSHISQNIHSDYLCVKMEHITGIKILLAPDYSRNEVGAANSRKAEEKINILHGGKKRKKENTFNTGKRYTSYISQKKSYRLLVC